MTQDEDRIWLEALAGRAAGAGDPATLCEAERLRACLLARRAEADLDLAAIDPRREDELVARARRVGLLPRRRAGLWTFGAVGWRAGFAVASLAVVTVAIGLVLLPGRRPEAVRGPAEGVLRLEAPDPVRLQREIVDGLREAGVEVSGYELLGRRGVDAELPRPVPPAIRRLLARHGIPVPADGVLRVEIAPRAEP
jgi:hypothetical protein